MPEINTIIEQVKPDAVVYGGQGSMSTVMTWHGADRIKIVTTANEFNPESGQLRCTVVGDQIVSFEQVREIEDDDVRRAAIALFVKREITQSIRAEDRRIRSQLGRSQA